MNRRTGDQRTWGDGPMPRSTVETTLSKRVAVIAHLLAEAYGLDRAPTGLSLAEMAKTGFGSGMAHLDQLRKDSPLDWLEPDILMEKGLLAAVKAIIQMIFRDQGIEDSALLALHVRQFEVGRKFEDWSGR